jgi:hypothetical protein
MAEMKRHPSRDSLETGIIKLRIDFSTQQHLATLVHDACFGSAAYPRYNTGSQLLQQLLK